jgi:hypothetical protein
MKRKEDFGHFLFSLFSTTSTATATLDDKAEEEEEERKQNVCEEDPVSIYP